MPAFGSSATSVPVSATALNTAPSKLIVTLQTTKNIVGASVGKRKTPGSLTSGSYPTVIDLKVRTASMLEGFVDLGRIYGTHSQTYKALHSIFGRIQFANDLDFFKAVEPGRYSASNALAHDDTMEKLLGKSRHTDRSARASLSTGDK